jgi:hypothetical protein
VCGCRDDKATLLCLADRLDRGDHIGIASPDGEISLEPAQVVNRIAVEELTPAQKRQVYARLAEGPADVKAGGIEE